MITSRANPFEARDSRQSVLLRTLVLLRWWAVAGQLGALLVAQQVLDLSLPYSVCYLVVGLSVTSNIVASFIFPKNRRLTQRETFLVVLFDMLQLSVLLYLTGGLHNPFSILIVGPVTVSASALTARSTITLGLLALLITSLLTQVFVPLSTQGGQAIFIPDLFLFGNWIAIIIAIVFLGVYSRRVVSEIEEMSEALQATQMALAREQKLTDLGGVVAAAAHELGTPLATIKLTSAELAEELDDHPDLREDALLIREQADRCRDILRSMGRAGKDDLHLRRAPLSAIVEEAAEPHMDRGKDINFEITADLAYAGAQPTILRRPEVIHGLRNLIQNAVDFSGSQIWIDSAWTEDQIIVRIMDDGPGYPPQFLDLIGEPFIRQRSSRSDPRRPGYEGMGLGLFIAKTLLERTGADLSFANGRDRLENREVFTQRTGAIVEVLWPRESLEDSVHDGRETLGDNQLIQT